MFLESRVLLRASNEAKNTIRTLIGRIRLLEKVGKEEDAFFLVKRSIEAKKIAPPIAPLFNALIIAGAGNRNLQMAVDSFQLMCKSDVPPDSSTYVALLNAYANVACSKESVRFLPEAKKRHYLTKMLDIYEQADAHRLLAPEVFNVMLKGISWLGTLEDLAMFFPLSEAKPLPVRPDEISFTTAIQCVAHLGGTCVDAERYFQEFRKRFPSSEVSSRLIVAMLLAYKSSLIRLGSEMRERVFGKARDFGKLHAESLLLRSPHVLDAMLSVYRHAGASQDGLVLLQRATLAKPPIIMDDALQATNMDLLAHAGRFSEAISLFKEMKTPTRLSITTIIEGSFHAKKPIECYRAFLRFNERETLKPTIGSVYHTISAIALHVANQEERAKMLKRVLLLIKERDEKLFLQFHSYRLEKVLMDAVGDAVFQDPHLLEILRFIPNSDSSIESTSI